MCIVCNTIARGAVLAYALVAGRKGGGQAAAVAVPARTGAASSRFECADIAGSEAGFNSRSATGLDGERHG